MPGRGSEGFVVAAAGVGATAGVRTGTAVCVASGAGVAPATLVSVRRASSSASAASGSIRPQPKRSSRLSVPSLVALAVNTSGGGLRYCHPGMFGIFLLIEAVRQLRAEAGERQVAKARRALVHGYGGIFAGNATVVLGRG